MPLLTFEQMWEEIGNETVSVLLGNGFSRSWREQPFSYETLYDAASFGTRDAEIRRVFDALGTQDFEKATSCLHASRDIVHLYSDNEEIVQQLETDAECIKNALLGAIADTHPSRPNEISEAEYRHVREFLAKFANIYTINYDLLMYWARNQADVPPEDWNTDDGFRGGRLWVGPETDQQVFFIHGGLHLYVTTQGVKKHAFSQKGQAIIDTVQENLQQNIFPLFVSEPSSAAKHSRINANPYLSYCLRRLSRASGAVFILGHGFSEVDRHLFSAIDHSAVHHVYVSLFGDPGTENNRRIRGNAAAWLATANRDVNFVAAQTVPIWRTA